MIIQYWNSSISIGVWIAIFWVLFTAVNFIPVKWYGEMEYWFVSIKVITILGFLIFAVCTNICNPMTSFCSWRAEFEGSLRLGTFLGTLGTNGEQS